MHEKHMHRSWRDFLIYTENFFILTTMYQKLIYFHLFKTYPETVLTWRYLFQLQSNISLLTHKLVKLELADQLDIYLSNSFLSVWIEDVYI